MKTLAILVLLTGTAVGDGRKPLPNDKWAKAAREAFTKAGEADQAGDLRSALGLYERAFAISPHPSCAYNVGDVQRRLGNVAASIKAFETYLALSPDAPDRKDVEALVAKLAVTPSTLVITTGRDSDPNAVDFKSSYVLVDGEIKLKPGTEGKVLSDSGGLPAVEVKTTGGEHLVEVISAITYGHHECKLKPGEREKCYLTAKPRIDGRYVVGARDVSVAVKPEKGADHVGNTRFEITPGKHRLYVRDRSFECPTIAIEAPAGANDVGYAYVGAREYDRLERCRLLDVKQLKLHFDP